MGESVSNQWSVLVLAAGYGTRLAKDIKTEGSSAYGSLLSLPKALLPVAGVPLIDYWYKELCTCPHIDMSKFFIATNHQFYSQFVSWGVTHQIPLHNIINDGSRSNDDRLGAIGDIVLCLQEFHSKVKESRGIIIIAGDTLFYDDFNISDYLNDLASSDHSGVLYYNIKEETETLKRGIIEVEGNYCTKLLEKPHPSMTTSRKACPAFYAYRSNLIDIIIDYHKSSLHLPIDERDAPGKLLSWILQSHADTHKISAREISGRFDIGNLQEYKETLNYFMKKLHRMKEELSLPHCVIEKCYARVGFMGNPSDGFNGKTISFLISNFYAEVTIQDNATSNEDIDSYIGIHYTPRVELIPHVEYDPCDFTNFQSLHSHLITKGYYGGIRLIQATCKVFSSYCYRNGIYIHLQRGFTLKYNTNIPRMVGLSGSSAIIVSTFRGLMRYYGLGLHDLHIHKTEFPQVILDIEKVELGISAGLQDRVIQTYGGLVYMDFTNPQGEYTELDPKILPPLYLAYNVNAGGESGKVHSTVRERWIRRDSDLVEGMKELGSYAFKAKQALLENDMKSLSNLIEANFAMRRKLYGDAVVGENNIVMSDMARSMGLAAKFTGSGGAFVCMRNDGVRGWLDEAQESNAVEIFREHGFELVRMQIPSIN